MATSGDDRMATTAEVYALLQRIRPLYRGLVGTIERNLADSGLTRPMRGVLERLYHDGPRTVPQIASALAVRRQFVQRVVNALIDAGLAERRPNRAHRRSWLIALTDEGERAFAALHEREWRRMARAAGEITAGEVAVAADVLDRLAAVVAAEEERPDAPASAGDNRRVEN